MTKYNVKWVKINDIKPYARNAKKHDDKQIANVAESIKQFGWQQPIVCDADGIIKRWETLTGEKAVKIS